MVAVVVFGSPFIVGDRYVYHVCVMVCVMATLALSMNLTLRMGQLSLAQGAFMGIGAYASALLTVKLGVPVPLSFLLSGLLCLLVALVLGPIFLRIKGVYFVLLTFCFAQIVDLIFQEQVAIFGGNNGMMGIRALPIFIPGEQTRSAYALGLLMLSFFYMAVSAIYRSSFGVVLSSIEESEALSRSLGLSAIRYRVAAFAFSASIAGFVGSFYAHYVGFLTPAAFAASITILALMINVVGGIKWPLGVVVGAVLLVPLPELLRDAKQYQQLFFGLIVIVMLLFARNGLVGLIRGRRAR